MPKNNRKKKRKNKKKKKSKVTKTQKTTTREQKSEVQVQRIPHVREPPSFDRAKCLQKLKKRQKLARQGINPQVAAQKVRQEMKNNPNLMQNFKQSMMSNMFNSGENSLNDTMSEDTLNKIMDMKGLTPKQRIMAQRFMNSLNNSS